MEMNYILLLLSKRKLLPGTPLQTLDSIAPLRHHHTITTTVTYFDASCGASNTLCRRRRQGQSAW
jgi:hypothetical protein